MGDAANLILEGPPALAMLLAFAAGLLSFVSPCMLPLVPGYLSYVTGLAGSELEDSGRRGRVVAGTILFVLGFTSVFLLGAVTISAASRALIHSRQLLQAIGGILIIALGLAYMGFGSRMQQIWRIKLAPRDGVLSAPLLGFIFALSWTPCVGPTLGAVMQLAMVGTSQLRATVMVLAYCAGMGVPFILFGWAFRRCLAFSGYVRRHGRVVTAVGGALLVLTGFTLSVGIWEAVILAIRDVVPLVEFIL